MKLYFADHRCSWRPFGVMAGLLAVRTVFFRAVRGTSTGRPTLDLLAPTWSVLVVGMLLQVDYS